MKSGGDTGCAPLEALVPSAVSVPWKEGGTKEVDFDRGDGQFALSKLPKDKNALFIMHCDGTICWKTYKSAVMAIEAGWKDGRTSSGSAAGFRNGTKRGCR